MQYELYEYDGLLFVEGDADETMNQIRSFAASSGFVPGDIYGHQVEIKYSGRDANRWFVSWLTKLAFIVQNASGEITCTITTNEGDPLFEYFRVEKGKLLRQRGHVIRDEPELLG